MNDVRSPRGAGRRRENEEKGAGKYVLQMLLLMHPIS
jgi:hypothetical protein